MLPMVMMIFSLALGQGSVQEGAPPYILVSLESGPSPYGEVYYQISEVGSVALACQVHGYSHGDIEETRCGIISKVRFSRILSDLSDLGIWEIGDGGEKSPLGATWGVQVGSSQGEVSFTASSPFLADDPVYRKVIRLVISEVVEATGREVFRDLFFEPNKVGFGSFWTHPWTRIWIDGVELSSSTPILSLELEAGAHRVRLVRPELGIDRAGQVKITGGKSTNFFFTVKPNRPTGEGVREKLEEPNSTFEE
jgi:hypothetical protein